MSSFVDPVTIQDPTTGLVATTALLASWRTDQEALRGVKAGCRCRTNTGTALGAAPGTAIPFELEDYDNNACHSTASNTSRITVPTGWAGIWLFGATVGVTTSNITKLHIFLNGSTTTPLTGASMTDASTNRATTSVQGFYRLAVADYIEVYAEAGTAVDVNFNAIFWAEWMAASRWLSPCTPTPTPSTRRRTGPLRLTPTSTSSPTNNAAIRQRPSARLSCNTTSQTLYSNTSSATVTTVLQCRVVDWDNNSMTGTNDRITVPSSWGGIYLLSCSCTIGPWQSNGFEGDCTISLRKNGTTNLGLEFARSRNVSVFCSAAFSVPVALVASDYVELVIVVTTAVGSWTVAPVLLMDANPNFSLTWLHA